MMEKERERYKQRENDFHANGGGIGVIHRDKNVDVSLTTNPMGGRPNATVGFTIKGGDSCTVL